LRLRVLYKWEKQFAPWEDGASSEILGWIEQKEHTWNALSGQALRPLSFLKRTYDPFDTAGVNAALEQEGLLYGAGYGRSLKPTFFLAPIVDKKRVDGHAVYVLGAELARDLATTPALNQDDCVVVRKASAKASLWDQMVYIKASGRFALRVGMGLCGVTGKGVEALQQGLEAVFAAQQETYIYHEIGEMHDTVFDRGVWREMIAAYPHTPLELLVRSVKDLLADTNASGPLRHITKQKKTASLAFYVAFFDGLSKELFPELVAAFKDFAASSDWDAVKKAVDTGYQNAKGHAETIMKIYESRKGQVSGDRIKEEIEKEVLGRIVP
ncbi:MAG: hypothetical protein JRI36_09030, partial [Deltaproteobacteria bacterium]|nr:hypothetical protein [Deltaproteobacteria bacterium]